MRANLYSLSKNITSLVCAGVLLVSINACFEKKKSDEPPPTEVVDTSAEEAAQALAAQALIDKAAAEKAAAEQAAADKVAAEKAAAALLELPTGDTSLFLQKAYLKLSSRTDFLFEDIAPFRLLVSQATSPLTLASRRNLISGIVTSGSFKAVSDNIQSFRSSADAEISRAGVAAQDVIGFTKSLYATKILKSYLDIGDDALYMVSKLKTVNIYSPLVVSAGSSVDSEAAERIAAVGRLVKSDAFSKSNPDLFPASSPSYCDISTIVDEQDRNDTYFLCELYSKLSLGSNISESDLVILKAEYIAGNRNQDAFVKLVVSNATIGLSEQLLAEKNKFNTTDQVKNAVNLTNSLISKYLNVSAGTNTTLTLTVSTGSCGLPTGSGIVETNIMPGTIDLTYKNALSICDTEVKNSYLNSNNLNEIKYLRAAVSRIVKTADFKINNESVFRPLYCQNKDLNQTHVNYGVCELFKAYVGRDITLAEKINLEKVTSVSSIISVGSVGILASQKANFEEIGWRIAGGNDGSQIAYSGIPAALVAIKGIARDGSITSGATGSLNDRKNFVRNQFIDLIFKNFFGADFEFKSTAITYNEVTTLNSAAEAAPTNKDLRVRADDMLDLFNLKVQIIRKLVLEETADHSFKIKISNVDGTTDSDFREIIRLFVHGKPESNPSNDSSNKINPNLILKYNAIVR